ncbi:MAG: YicC family protein [Candidatus Omnitrophica bacterium]|nr:YicC family protein [Candidatus Omnitrophota bacterium]
MIIGMTGFGTSQGEINEFGKYRVEIRSSNHKFLDIVLHLPEGFLSLEDQIKKEIEARAKRGRITCVINTINKPSPHVFINKQLLKNYISEIKKIQGEFHVAGSVGMSDVLHLPGVLSLNDSKVPSGKMWPGLKILVRKSMDDLVSLRKKEGEVLYRHLKVRLEDVLKVLNEIQERFKKVIKEKLVVIKIPEERSSFLKSSDITEELERLSFHAKNCKETLSKNGSVGKELDFIAQEMQREANTMGAKTFDAVISSRVVHIKSQIEKIREQLQNIE